MKELVIKAIIDNDKSIFQAIQSKEDLLKIIDIHITKADLPENYKTVIKNEEKFISPLHFAVWLGDIDIVKLLIEKGADWNLLVPGFQDKHLLPIDFANMPITENDSDELKENKLNIALFLYKTKLNQEINKMQEQKAKTEEELISKETETANLRKNTTDLSTILPLTNFIGSIKQNVQDYPILKAFDTLGQFDTSLAKGSTSLGRPMSAKPLIDNALSSFSYKNIPNLMDKYFAVEWQELKSATTDDISERLTRLEALYKQLLENQAQLAGRVAGLESEVRDIRIKLANYEKIINRKYKILNTINTEKIGKFFGAFTVKLQDFVRAYKTYRTHVFAVNLGTAVNVTSEIFTIAGAAIPFPGAPSIAELLNWGVRAGVEHHQNKVINMLAAVVSYIDSIVEDIIVDTGFNLIETYKDQIVSLSGSQAFLLGECAVWRIIEAIRDGLIYSVEPETLPYQFKCAVDQLKPANIPPGGKTIGYINVNGTQILATDEGIFQRTSLKLTDNSNNTVYTFPNITNIAYGYRYGTTADLNRLTTQGIAIGNNQTHHSYFFSRHLTPIGAVKPGTEYRQLDATEDSYTKGKKHKCLIM
jgi:hypothetical protein